MSASNDALPPELPLFPLRGVLLLPGGRLPLNVFEPRYLQMVTDALGAGRLIGMIQPQPRNGSASSLPESRPLLYPVGCAGRIVHFEETPDGRFLVTLLGVQRFRLEAETGRDLPYGHFRVDWGAFAADDPDGEIPPECLPDRAGFITTACRYLERHRMSFDPDVIRETPLDRLTTAIAMICPLRPEEKQALLETPDVPARVAMLLALMEMALYDQSGEGLVN